MLGMRTCLPCHIPDRWSRNANRIWPDLRPDLAFGSVHKLYIRLVVGTARISTLEKRNVDCMTEDFKGITSTCHASAIADHVTSTGHNLKWDHFEILAKGRSDTHCKIKETLLIQETQTYPKRYCQQPKGFVCISLHYFFNANCFQLLSLLLLISYLF